MKRALFAALLVLAVLAGAFFFWKRAPKEEAKPAEDKEEATSHISHDESGRVVIKMDDETQGNLGLLVEKPSPAQVSPELKAYGRVLDPTPLATLAIELATAQAAAAASSNEFTRLKTLASQGNTSESKLQVAEAQARRDQLAIKLTLDKLVLSWGKGVAEQTNLPAFVQPLATQSAALVRVDLPPGEGLIPEPKGARLETLSEKFTEAEFLGTTASVDPQTLSRGAVFLVRSNTLALLPGEAVTAHVELPGEPLTGVIIPSKAVIRPEGKSWVYVMESGGDAFTRTEVSLENPTTGGWLVTKGVTTNDYVVVTGAQVLLSEESKSALKGD